MSWLPRLEVVGTTVCERAGEYEGTTLQVFWRSWVFEFTFARWEDRADAR